MLYTLFALYFVWSIPCCRHNLLPCILRNLEVAATKLACHSPNSTKTLALGLLERLASLNPNTLGRLKITVSNLETESANGYDKRTLT